MWVLIINDRLVSNVRTPILCPLVSCRRLQKTDANTHLLDIKFHSPITKSERYQTTVACDAQFHPFPWGGATSRPKIIMVLFRSSFVTEDTICGILPTRGLNDSIIIHQCAARRAAGTTVRSLNLEAVFLRRRIYGMAEYYIRCIIALGDPQVLLPQPF